MRRGGRTLLGLLVLMSGPAAIAMTATPASAGLTSTLTVTKAVDGTAPPGAQFMVDIDCGSEPVAPAQMTFTGPGSHDAMVVLLLKEDVTCTVVESATAGASVTYACEVTSGSATCANNNTVDYTSTPNQSATITVTNTFPPPPAPPAPGAAQAGPAPAAAEPVEAAARFTG